MLMSPQWALGLRVPWSRRSCHAVSRGARSTTRRRPAQCPDVYLKECASCGGQFPSYRAICSECQDVADEEGYRDGKKAVAAALAS